MDTGKHIIEYIHYGIGYRLPDGRIQLNHNLKRYPRLHDEILAHELGHSSQVFSLHNFTHDLMNNPGLEFYSFIIRHPSTWTAILPVRWVNGRLGYDPIGVTNWILTIPAAYILYKVIAWVL